MKTRTGALTLRRGGEFEFTTSGPNHCSTEERIRLEYLVEAECAINLDSRGFLFDQLKVGAYFDSIKHVNVSCEELAMQAARDVWEIIMNDHSGCKIYDFKLSLRSKGWTAAFVTFHFNEERDTIPAPFAEGEQP